MATRNDILQLLRTKNSDCVENKGVIIKLLKNGEIDKLISKIDKERKICLINFKLFGKNEINGLEQFLINLDAFINYFCDKLLVGISFQYALATIFLKSKYNYVLLDDKFIYDGGKNQEYYYSFFQKMIAEQFLDNLMIMKWNVYPFLNNTNINFDSLSYNICFRLSSLRTGFRLQCGRTHGVGLLAVGRFGEQFGGDTVLGREARQEFFQRVGILLVDVGVFAVGLVVGDVAQVTHTLVEPCVRHFFAAIVAHADHEFQTLDEGLLVDGRVSYHRVDAACSLVIVFRADCVVDADKFAVERLAFIVAQGFDGGQVAVGRLFGQLGVDGFFAECLAIVGIVV